MSRLVCHFSCGATSAVATKLTLAAHGLDVPVVNAFVKQEHPDNRRFLADCERWFGRPITVLRDQKYGASTIEVFRREQFMKGLRGAPCTRLLKRKVLERFHEPGDILVIGYDADEAGRLEDFKRRYPDVAVVAPLIERGLTKDDCKAIVERAGLVLPLMYQLGYDNANCIGCVKGGEGYFRAIAIDFPAEFAELADTQESIGPGAYLHRDRETGVRYSLRNIPPGPVRRNERLPSCSFFCEMAEEDIANG